MKTVLKSFAIILVTSVITFTCGIGNNDTKTVTKINNDSNKQITNNSVVK